MKKVLVVFVALLFFGFTYSPVNAGPGPAPNAGDGISDGSGVGFPPSPGPQGKQ